MPLDKTVKFGGHDPKPPLPEDVYQCQIEDITLQAKPKYKGKDGETEDMLTFKFVILEDGEFYGRKLFKDMRPLITKASAGRSASNLYDFLSSIAGRELLDEEIKGIDAERINGLIGRQVRLTVKITDKGKNKVAGALKVKTSLPTFIEHESEVPLPDEEPS